MPLLTLASPRQFKTSLDTSSPLVADDIAPLPPVASHVAPPPTVALGRPRVAAYDAPLSPRAFHVVLQAVHGLRFSIVRDLPSCSQIARHLSRPPVTPTTLP